MIITCDVCGKEFNRKPSKISTKNYCSNECNSKGMLTGQMCTCATCGKQVYKRKSDIEKSKTGNVYCSRSCATSNNNTILRTGENHPNWQDKHVGYRLKAFELLPNECEVCGYNKIPGILQVHHKDRDRTNGHISNLQILCPTCHCEEHFNSNDGLFWNNTKNNVEE